MCLNSTNALHEVQKRYGLVEALGLVEGRSGVEERVKWRNGVRGVRGRGKGVGRSGLEWMGAERRGLE